MDFSALKTRLFERLDEDPSAPVHYTATEAANALNKAQRRFAFLTLCIERTATFELDANTTFYTFSADDADFTTYLRPLRVTCNGKRVFPATINELDALNSDWRVEPGTPTRYVTMGFDLLAVSPRPSSSGTSLVITSAGEPAALTGSTDTPEIPEEHHPALIDFAIYWMRLKEGGQEFKNAVEYLGGFLEAAAAHADFTRARGAAQMWDVMPFDLRAEKKAIEAMLKVNLRKAA